MDNVSNQSDPPDWSTLTREEPIDPSRRIVDAHHHLWGSGEGHSQGEQYLIEDLLADTQAGHNVTETVFMQCMLRYRDSGPEALRPVGETEFVATQAKASEASATRIAAIVSFADLTLGDAVEEVLRAHERAGEGRFRGIRQPIFGDPQMSRGDPSVLGRMADAGFRRGLARLGQLGYTFDAFVFHPQLSELADLARVTQETNFVVDHLGGPLNVGPFQNRDEVREVWRRGMRQLVSCENVSVKLGGVGMDSLFATGWSSRAQPPRSDEVVEWWGDDIRWCIDTFGPSRCMFESNFPVDRRSVGYVVLWNAFKKIARGYSESEQNALVADTAASFYRIS
jgi:predicted TIM-barrel fold metal-dependent hydrolase